MNTRILAALCIITPATALSLPAPARAQATAASSLTMKAGPEPVCLDDRVPSYLNFDLLLHNAGAAEARVTRVRATVTDSTGSVTERRMLWQGGLDVIGDTRSVPAGDERIIFNPFHFTTASAGSKIRYELDTADGATQAVTITPRACEIRTRLMLPLTGRVLVYDGHDMLSHHRRFNYANPGIRAFGITGNFQRYALDLVAVGEDGSLFNGDGSRNEQWVAWSRPVRAAAAGVVTDMHNEMPDNDTVGTENRWVDRDIRANEMSPAGNYVLIDHGNGEFSYTAHLRQGSVSVRKGDRVAAGEIIGEVGNSGSSLGPHLHYELRSGWGLRGVTNLPARFHDVSVTGGPAETASGVVVNSGDVLVVR